MEIYTERKFVVHVTCDDDDWDDDDCHDDVDSVDYDDDGKDDDDDDDDCRAASGVLSNINRQKKTKYRPHSTISTAKVP